MKIVADENIPYVKELFAPLGEIILRAGRTITHEDIRDADILLVRSVTKVDEALLSGSSIKFVGTCTIGTDHLDTAYLQRSAVHYASAPGCNANAVVQYVVSALAHMDLLTPNLVADITGSTEVLEAQAKKVAIVGCGNVGSRVYSALNALGFRCQCVDPYLSADQRADLVSFDEAVYDADVICVHTPLTKEGEHPTEGLFSAEVLSRLKPGAILINAGRGEVVDNSALLARLKECGQGQQGLNVILDVWESEPNITVELLDYLVFGTPHIAGYSFDGRVTGSLMIFDALVTFLGLDSEQSEHIVAGVKEGIFANVGTVDLGDISTSFLKRPVLSVYDIAKDSAALKQERGALPAAFDRLRKEYPIRREFTRYRCCLNDSFPKGEPAFVAQLNSLGFVLEKD